MRRLRAHRQLAAWIGVLAVLLMSLAPALSHALGRAGSAAWVEVCSAEGSRWVQAEPGDAAGAPGAVAHLLEHCPYCSSHVPSLDLPPAPDFTGVGLGLQHEVPQTFLAAARTQHTWLRAQPRAPPFHF